MYIACYVHGRSQRQQFFIGAPDVCTEVVLMDIAHGDQPLPGISVQFFSVWYPFL